MTGPAPSPAPTTDAPGSDDAVVAAVLGQDLGALYTGRATDPNSGLVLAVMAIALLAGSRGIAPSRESPDHKEVD